MNMNPRMFWLLTAEHLWQCSLVVLAVIVISRICRRAPARVRYSLWLVALVKFFLPLAVFGGIGSAVFGGLSPPLGRFLAPTIHVTAGATNATWIDPFAVAMLIWFAGACLLVGGWVRHSARATHRETGHSAKLARIATACGIPAARIETNTSAEIPSVVGLFRPRIVVPAVLIERLTDSELRAILLHEDAHRRSFDPLFNAVERVALACFYFFPPLWLVLSRVRATREMARDEQVLAQSVSGATYGRALAQTISICLVPAAGVTAAVGQSRSLLATRLRLISAYDAASSAIRVRHFFPVAAGVLLVVLTSFFPPSLMAGPFLPGQDGVTSPRRIHEVDVEYPPKARADKVEAQVVLQAVIRTDGTVSDVKVLSCDQADYGFEDAAVAAVEQWLYEPAEKDGEPVDAYFTVIVSFRLE